MMYEVGYGVPQNSAEAMKWFRRAADQGDYDGQSWVSVMYRDGKGVPIDFVRAYMWASLAAQNTEHARVPHSKQSALSNRDFIATMMTPAQIAEAQKLAREWKP